jgi:hypothetical protein
VELAVRGVALVASDEDNAAVLHALQACVHVLELRVGDQAVLALAWANVRECHSTTGKHGAALVVMWAGDLPNEA